MITVKQAQAQLIESLSCHQLTEVIAVDNALGRVVAQDVISSIMIPPNDNSAMDGFAINSEDLQGFDSQKTLIVSQRIPAGTAAEPLEKGTAARIFTGGMMPSGADAVVIQENCDYDSDDKVTIKKTVVSQENVRPAGQDIPVGKVVVIKGQRLNAIDLSLITAVGKASVKVYKPLKVAVFSTGDELAEPGDELKPGQIYNSNRTFLIALCQQMGFEAVDIGTVEDTLDATKEALNKASASADFILSSGGVSVGDEDHVKPAVEALGSLDLWKVRMKPGKPVAFGQVNGVPFLGLPGNPVSSFVVFQLLAVPALQALQGQIVEFLRPFLVQAGFNKKITSREEYIRVQLHQESSDGGWIATPYENSSSGVLTSLSWAHGLVRQEIDQEIQQGDSLDYFALHDGLL